MAETPLFDWHGDAAPDELHAESLRRVRSKIGAAVLGFLRERLGQGRPVFSIAELHAHVTEVHGVAPASPDRILRDARQRGLCDYEVVSRRLSLYRVISVGPAGPAGAEGGGE